MSDMIGHAVHLPRVRPEVVDMYGRLADDLVDSVNARMAGRHDLNSLIGANPVEVMFANHRNHAAFMASVFHFGNYALLARTLPWVYRAYHNQGFSHDYFRVVLLVWMEVVREAMPQGAEDILVVYEWMLARHEETVGLSLQPAAEPDAGSPDWQADFEKFRDALLAGDVPACLEVARRRADTGPGMVDFFMHVLHPAMYAVGARWENGLIGVAQEHLASAIVSRVLASIPVPDFRMAASRGRAVVSAAANEFHEIGAWMTAACLEFDGWEVRYLGANTPCSDLMAFVRSERPDLLCLSVAMAFNIGAIKSVVDAVRNDESLAGTKILVGGQAVRNDPNMIHILKADAVAMDCRSAMEVARSFSFRRLDESQLS